MNKVELLQNYIKINNSYKKNLVFHIGVNSGFFSEFNNMVLAILYCLKFKIKFQLYSDDANFRKNKGWQDFFLPFCTEIHDEKHTLFNRRWINTDNKYLNKEANLFKKENGITYLTADIWHKFNNHFFSLYNFSIPELGIKGKTQSSAHQIVKMLWRYNPPTEKIINERKKQVSLYDEYIGFHIRAGDKNTEHNIIEGENYIQKAEQLSSVRNGFILTDDYRVFSQLKNSFPHWNLHTLCSSSEKGYFHNEYMKKTLEEKTDMLLSLFSAVDILSESKLFIGTYSSNPGMFLGMKMKKEAVHGMDYKQWKTRW